MTRTRYLDCLLAAAVLMLAACPPASPPPVPPGIQQPGADPNQPPSAPPPVATPVVEAADASVPALAEAGAACNEAGDCASGICEGLGCGSDEGVCAPKQRGCTRDLSTYCSCDGTTVHGSGSCPGVRYAYRGACAAPLADGAPCESGDQCASGMCEGQGCDRSTPGICVPAGRMCTADVAEYCDCRGRPFGASSSCPGRRYRARGSCPP